MSKDFYWFTIGASFLLSCSMVLRREGREFTFANRVFVETKMAASITSGLKTIVSCRGVFKELNTSSTSAFPLHLKINSLH